MTPDVGPNSWWHMKHAQHAAHNTKLKKNGIIQIPPIVTIKKTKEPAHMVESCFTRVTEYSDSSPINGHQGPLLLTWFNLILSMDK